MRQVKRLLPYVRRYVQMAVYSMLPFMSLITI